MGFSDLINTLSTWKIYQFEQLVSLIFTITYSHDLLCFWASVACAARAVNQQPPVIDGVTGAWGKGVSGPLSVWWSFPPSPPSRFYFVYSLRGV